MTPVPPARAARRTAPPPAPDPVPPASPRLLRFGNPGGLTGFPNRRHRESPPYAADPAATRRAGARRRLHGDSGNAAVELAPVALILLLFLGLLIAAGRITVTRMAVNDAARDAARQASISRSPGDAQAAAVQSADAALSADGLDCNPSVTVDTTGFAVPVGEPAQVTATVTCDVRLSDLTAVPGMPGSRSLTATFTSPLDPYRAR